MTTITFKVGYTNEVQTVHLNSNCDTIFTWNNKEWIAYNLHDIASIIPPKEKAPTQLQNQFAKELQSVGYKWDKQHSAAAAGIVLKRADGDFWFFGMEGEIMHNPEGIKIPVDNSKPRLSHEKDIF